MIKGEVKGKLKIKAEETARSSCAIWPLRLAGRVAKESIFSCQVAEHREHLGACLGLFL